MATFNLKPLQEAVKNLRNIAPYKCEEVQKSIMFKKNALLASNDAMALVIASDMSMLGEEFLIPAKAFDLILALTGDEAEITASGTDITIRCGKVKNTFKTFAVDAYMIPPVDAAPAMAEVDAEKFASRIAGVLPAIKEGENKVLSGCYIRAGEGRMTTVGLSNHQICVGTIEGVSGEFGANVPKKALMELSKLRLKGKLKIMASATGITFSGNGVSLYSRLIDGEFPAWERFLSMAGSETVTVDRNELMQATKRIKACSAGDEKVPMVLNFSNDGLTMSLNTQFADCEEKLDINAGKDVRIGFQPKLLEQALACMTAEQVNMGLQNSHSPVYLTEDGFTSIVMPVNIG